MVVSHFTFPAALTTNLIELSHRSLRKLCYAPFMKTFLPEKMAVSPSTFSAALTTNLIELSHRSLRKLYYAPSMKLFCQEIMQKSSANGKFHFFQL
jgi:hypothetical protein